MDCRRVQSFRSPSRALSRLRCVTAREPRTQIACPTARRALEIEKQVLRYLRRELGLPCAEAMSGKAGHTETVPSDRMPVAALVDLVTAAMASAA